MKDLKHASLIAVMLLGAVGCSSSGGSTGTGGKSGGTGGGPGSGGHGGSAGSGGGGKACGGPAVAPDAGVCQQAPCDGLIADFSSADAGIPIIGGLTTWSGILKPTYTVDNGVLNIMEDVTQADHPQYLGTTLYFNNCIDASAFQGVQFKISGSISAACQLIFGANDVAHDDQYVGPQGQVRRRHQLLRAEHDGGSDPQRHAPDGPDPLDLGKLRSHGRPGSPRTWSVCSGSSRSRRRWTAVRPRSAPPISRLTT